MLKVIIAEDEKIQREGLVTYIPWNNYEMEIAGCASDGEEALELAARIRPDILVTDVKMPRMDGLELAQKVKEFLPEIKVLMISGYKEFEFVKAAIELNAYAFILKPIDMTGLEQELARLCKKCREEASADEEMASMRKQLEEGRPLFTDRFIKDLLYGYLAEEEAVKKRAEFLSFPYTGCSFFVSLIQIDDQDLRERKEEALPLFFHHFYQYLQEICRQVGSTLLIQFKENEFVLVNFETRLLEMPVIQLVQEIHKNITDKFGRPVTLGISNRKESIIQLHEGLREAEIASRHKLYLGKGKIIDYRDIESTESYTPVSLDDLYEKLTVSMEIGNTRVVDEAAKSIFGMLLKLPVEQEYYIRAFCYRIAGDIYRILYNMNEKVENLFGDEYILWNKISRYDTIPDIFQWLGNIIGAVTGFIYNKRAGKNSSAVEVILDALEKRYPEHITIEELARQVHLAPSYLCNLFKERVGESIIDYLTKVRMKHARRLLSDTSLMIYEVAEKVGFNNTSYFGSVFKGSFGMTPKEYREKLLSGVEYGG